MDHIGECMQRQPQFTYSSVGNTPGLCCLSQHQPLVSFCAPEIPLPSTSWRTGLITVATCRWHTLQCITYWPRTFGGWNGHLAEWLKTIIPHWEYFFLHWSTCIWFSAPAPDCRSSWCQVIRFLPPTWETWIAYSASSIGPVVGVRGVNQWMGTLSLLLFFYCLWLSYTWIINSKKREQWEEMLYWYLQTVEMASLK